MPSVVPFIVVIVSIATAWYLSMRLSYRVLPVERLEWPSSQPFAADMISRTLPLVLTNTHVAKWKVNGYFILAN
jgi:hypothetical protein